MRATKETKTNKGITLIALVITIIVMLILVGVTISMAVNGGLFDYAGRAVGETKNAIKAEGQIAEGGIKVGETWYNSIDEYLNKDKNNIVEIISKETEYVGCYADIDGDGTVEGVIYADLLHPIEDGEYYGDSYTYGEEVVEAEEVKDYYVSGTYDGDFNEEGEPKEVLTATGEGTDRFYVMALEDVTTADYTTFSWYCNAYGNMDASDTSTEFGTGKTNTETIKGIWDANTETPYGTQYAEDLWAQLDLTNDWFVPSIAEWLAFADAFDVNSSNYSDTYGLNCYYWSSSQYNTDYAWNVFFDEDTTFHDDVNAIYCVRLSATF